ncbi:GNAT family N-acetyltransferase [Bacillus sp. FJAT-49732]|uniref:GNAT family N-acetyltransferase n=1 Tax=Lederbergia citrisecunda TaxID=2833583 RepID=A0A942TN69_9BACI|nr:GNAT family N-acetyltransferase [Lederbergia citrisecunda]
MMFLYSIEVLPEYQNRGNGSELIESLKEITRQKKLLRNVFIYK